MLWSDKEFGTCQMRWSALAFAGMLNGRANDIKKHAFFEGLDWTALEARRLEPPRKPKDDCAKRIMEMTETESNEPKPEEDPAELAECEVVFANF